MSQSSGRVACADDPEACQLRNRLPGSFMCCLPGLLRVSAVSAQTTLSRITQGYYMGDRVESHRTLQSLLEWASAPMVNEQVSE